MRNCPLFLMSSNPRLEPQKEKAPKSNAEHEIRNPTNDLSPNSVKVCADPNGWQGGDHEHKKVNQRPSRSATFGMTR
jgi:hypothetical protein